MAQHGVLNAEMRYLVWKWAAVCVYGYVLLGMTKYAMPPTPRRRAPNAKDHQRAAA